MKAHGAAVVLVLLFVPAIAPTPLAAEAQPAGTGDVSLMFFEVVEGAAPSNPNSYERRVLLSGTQVYIARAPALIFHSSDIVSVVIKRKRTAGTGSQEHAATISLRPDVAAQLRRFSDRNLGRRVDIHFNGERLSTPLIVAPIPSGVISLDVGPSPERINRVFGPLGAKLSWSPGGG